MRRGPYARRFLAALWLCFPVMAIAAEQPCPSLLAHSLPRLTDQRPASLCEFRGKVLLVVNTASQCGYTGQYAGLEALHERYASRGFAVLGFPTNDFGGQEPGGNREIAEFCRTVYGIGFPMFAKSSLSGPESNPLYQALVTRSGERPRWNFHKYLVDRAGARVLSFGSAVAPESRELVAAIESFLQDK